MSTATMNGNGVRKSNKVAESEIIEAIKDEGTEVVNVQASQPVVPPVVTTMDRQALLRAYDESFDRSVKSIGTILDNTALSVYCQVGADCFDTIYRAKNLFDAETQERLGKDAKSSWSVNDFDDQCGRLSMRCRVLFPHLFLPSKEASDESEAKGKRRDPVRVSDYILAFKAVEALKTLPAVAACVENLSYFLVINYIARKCISFSRTELTAEIKSDWAEFCRVQIPQLASGKILVRDFLNLLNSHEVKLDEAKAAEKHAGKTPEQIKAMEADAETKKKTREKSSKENRIRTAISTSLSDAMSGVLTPDQIADIVSKSASDAKIVLPAFKLDPATVSSADVLDILKGMWMAKRFDALREITTACAEMARTLDMFDTKAERKAG